jgi:hypothetical protein
MEESVDLRILIERHHPFALVGFLEMLENSMDGGSDLVKIAAKQCCNIEELIPMLDTGEMLELIQRQEKSVSITEKGRSFISASPKVRNRMARDVIINLDIFKKLIGLIKNSEKGHITKDEALILMTESPALSSVHEKQSDFDWIIEWGRSALIFDYDADKQTISLKKHTD